MGDALGEELGVGDEEVIADELGGLAELVGDHLPAGPIVFGAAVFDRDDRILFLQLRVVGHKFLGALHRLVGLLEDIGFLLLVEEFRARDIESDRDVVAHLVAGLFNRLANHAKCVIGTLKVWRKATFVTHGGGKTAIVKDLLERVENFGTVAQRLTQRRRTDRHDHEFLEVDRRVRVGTAIDDVHHRHRQHLRIGSTEVLVERHAELCGRGLGHCHRDTENCIGTKVLLGRAAIEREHRGIDRRLLGRAVTQERRSNLVVHIVDGLEHTLSKEALLVAVAKLNSFMLAGRCSRRNSRAANGTAVQLDINFNSGIAA